jgi:hypothetical protein
VDADSFSTDEYLSSLQTLNDAGSDALTSISANASDLSETFQVQMYFILGQIEDSVNAVSDQVVVEVADEIEDGATIGSEESDTYTNDYIDGLRNLTALRNAGIIVSSILGAGIIATGGVIADEEVTDADGDDSGDDDSSTS